MTWCIGQAAVWAMGFLAAGVLLLAVVVAVAREWLAARARRARDSEPVIEHGTRLTERKASARRRGQRRRAGW